MPPELELLGLAGCVDRSINTYRDEMGWEGRLIYWQAHQARFQRLVSPDAKNRAGVGQEREYGNVHMRKVVFACTVSAGVFLGAHIGKLAHGFSHFASGLASR
jgi:hypothetical protein